MDYSNLDVVTTFSPSKGIFSPRTHIHVQTVEESNVQFNIKYQLSVISRAYQKAYKDAPNCTVELKKTFKFNLTERHFNFKSRTGKYKIRSRNIYIKRYKMTQVRRAFFIHDISYQRLGEINLRKEELT